MADGRGTLSSPSIQPSVIANPRRRRKTEPQAHLLLVIGILCRVHVDRENGWYLFGPNAFRFADRLPTFKQSEPHTYLQRQKLALKTTIIQEH